MAEQTSRRQSTFTNAEISSYERSFTAMSFVWADGRGMISLAPIFDEFIDKQPKKGDNVYDYDSKMNFSVDAQGAVQIRSALNTLMDNEELKMTTVTFGGGKQSRTISFFKPGTLKLSGKTYDNYVMRVTTKRDDEEEKMYHIMQNSTIGYKTTDNEETEDTIETDLILLLEFCQQVIVNGFSGAYHGARRAGGSAPSGDRGSKRQHRRVEEEDGEGGEGGDDDDGGSRKSGGGAKKPAAKKAKLDDEFGDE